MNIKNIRNYLSIRVGCKINIIYYGGRNRRERYKGILYKTYNNIFTVLLDSGEIKSFSYSDILTKTVQICI
jgi:uncharacterized protein Veg